MSRYLFIVLAVATLGVSELAQPNKKSTETATAELHLDAIAPRRVGEWQAVDVLPDVVLGDRREGDLTPVLYENVMMRTYKRARDGAVLWLVVAHGGDQRGGYALHVPEMCYRSLGFEVEARGNVAAAFHGVDGKIRQVVARSPQRLEPISYWVVLGDDIVVGQLHIKLRELWNGLTARKTPGTLVRVSIPMRGDAIDSAYAEQRAFIEEFLQAWPQQARHLIWPSHSKSRASADTPSPLPLSRYGGRGGVSGNL